MLKPLIKESKDENWVNWHRTKKVGGTVSSIIKPYNCYEDHSKPEKEFIPGLAGLQSIINQAAAVDAKVRAYGSRWSLNSIAYNNEFLIDSTNLDYCLIGIKYENQVTQEYQTKRNCLSFVQCGVRVKDLNKKLQIEKLALPTTGASDGQTFIGAVSTGTHGSAHAVGAMQEYVRGIHLVTLNNEHVFIQRETDAVVTNKFCDWLGKTKLIQDDALFNSALVGMGSFGLVHGLLIETVPLYLLGRFIKNCDFDEVNNAICTLNMNGLGLPGGDDLPFHFEVVLNPYRLKPGKKGAFIRVLYKVNSDEGTLHKKNNSYKLGNDIFASMMRSFDFKKYIPDVILRPLLAEGLQLALEAELPPSKSDELELGYPGDLFSDSYSTAPTSPSPLPSTSIEVGVPLSRVKDAMDLILKVTEEYIFAAPLAFRYVKSSLATLAFTGFSPITVAMEMPGLDNEHSLAAHNAIFAALAKSDIPHSYHWGQGLPINPDWVSKSYGEDKLDSWKQHRIDLLGEKGSRMFVNKLLEDIGLL
jgi:hypothetical protein